MILFRFRDIWKMFVCLFAILIVFTPMSSLAGDLREEIDGVKEGIGKIEQDHEKEGGELEVRIDLLKDEKADPSVDIINGLKARVEELERTNRETMKRLEAHIDFLEDEVLSQATPVSTPSGQRLNVFNPQMTVFGNFVARKDSRTVLNDQGKAVDNRFNLREVEADFRAVIDPWADGVVITTFDSETPREFVAGIEEGYIILKRLPGLNLSPWGLKIKAGHFRPDFGRFNIIHTHDLPQTVPPLALQTFLGEEGMIGNGVSGQFFLPLPWERNVVEASLEVLNGGGLPVAAENDGENPAFLGHLKWFTDLAPGHDVEIGASSYHGKYDREGRRNARLYGLDFQYKWKPYAGGEWRSFLFGGEFFRAQIDGMNRQGGDPFGYYLWSQYQFNRQTYLGVRYDRSDDLRDDLLHRAISTYLSYYTTEFLRLRLGYEHFLHGDVDPDGRDTVYMEMNFVFGSHPVEPYWVSR